jgi:hypothetical protein
VKFEIKNRQLQFKRKKQAEEVIETGVARLSMALFQDMVCTLSVLKCLCVQVLTFEPIIQFSWNLK